eukprot:gene30356-37603_t
MVVVDSQLCDLLDYVWKNAIIMYVKSLKLLLNFLLKMT